MSIINWNKRIVLPKTDLFWLDHYNHVIDKTLWVSVYQNSCKIYLDEYEGQKELRENFFVKMVYYTKLLLHIIPEDEYSNMKEKRIDFLLREENKFIEENRVSKNIDNYFYNRWLRRN